MSSEVLSVRRVRATRYVTPLREGGSVPAIMEADDDGLYVVKFRGAAQGPPVLVAELLAGEIGRLLGLRVPELVLVDLDPVLGRSEPDPELQELITGSGGLNLGLDYLPGSIGFDLAAKFPVSAEEASAITWFDAFITNVDRTPRNPNMLIWHRQLWLIDHGASFYFHHSWENYLERARTPFPAIADHIFLPFASELSATHERLAPLLTDDALRGIVEMLPDEWLEPSGAFASPAEQRKGYLEYLMERRDAAEIFTEEAERARDRLV